MSQCLEEEATSPGAQHQSIPIKGRRAGQHSTGDAKYSQTCETWDMETQGVRLGISKRKDIREEAGKIKLLLGSETRGVSTVGCLSSLK